MEIFKTKKNRQSKNAKKRLKKNVSTSKSIHSINKNFRECERLLAGYKVDILQLKRIINNPNQQTFIKTSGINHLHLRISADSADFITFRRVKVELAETVLNYLLDDIDLIKRRMWNLICRREE